MASTTEIRIRYRRPPQRETVFVQRLIARRADGIVTLMDRTPLDSPLVIGGRVALAPGAPAVWFTFADAWHDIGRFHDEAGRFTGLYANVITPVAGLDGNDWSTTDLFLDLWWPVGGEPALLDEVELRDACKAGIVEPATCAHARKEGARLLAAWKRRTWPPPIVQEFTLEYARRMGGTPGDGVV